MSRILGRVSEALSKVAMLLLLFTTFTIGYSILARIINVPSPVWVVQFNEYALLWITFLGTAWLLSNNKHVSVGIVFERLNTKARKVMGLVHSLLGMALCALLCGYGVFTTWEQYQRRVMDIQVIDVPVAYVIAVIPLGFFLLFLQFINRFFSILNHPEESESMALKSASSEDIPDQVAANNGTEGGKN